MSDSNVIAARSWTDRAATAVNLAEILGELDPIVVEKLLATGASGDEVVAAVRAIEDELEFGERHHQPSSSKEAEAREILEELVFDVVEESQWNREIART